MANEKRLIDLDRLIRSLKAMASEYDAVSLHGIINSLKEWPAVDAVEVVRCKDCKYYDNSEGIYWCELNSKFFPGGIDWHGFPEDGFCSYGERKSNG